MIILIVVIHKINLVMNKIVTSLNQAKKMKVTTH